MKRCPTCEAVTIVPSFRYCSNDGALLIESPACPRCDQEVLARDRYCPRCGHNLILAAEAKRV
jgi:ribosomal protein S27AE